MVKLPAGTRTRGGQAGQSRISPPFTSAALCSPPAAAPAAAPATAGAAARDGGGAAGLAGCGEGCWVGFVAGCAATGGVDAGLLPAGDTAALGAEAAAFSRSI